MLRSSSIHRCGRTTATCNSREARPIAAFVLSNVSIGTAPSPVATPPHDATGSRTTAYSSASWLEASERRSACPFCERSRQRQCGQGVGSGVLGPPCRLRCRILPFVRSTGRVRPSARSPCSSSPMTRSSTACEPSSPGNALPTPSRSSPTLRCHVGSLTDLTSWVHACFLRKETLGSRRRATGPQPPWTRSTCGSSTPMSSAIPPASTACCAGRALRWSSPPRYVISKASRRRVRGVRTSRPGSCWPASSGSAASSDSAKSRRSDRTA